MSSFADMNVGITPTRRQRDPHDFYPTRDAGATLAFLEREKPYLQCMQDDSRFLIWEPACGDGAMAKLFTWSGYAVWATDLIDRGYGVGGMDFLKATRLPSRNTAIITNPPFGETAEPFVRHALQLGPPYVAMLLKSSFFNTRRGRLLLEQYPLAAAYPLDWRLDFHGLGNPVMTFTWWVWDKARPHMPFTPLSRPAS